MNSNTIWVMTPMKSKVAPSSPRRAHCDTIIVRHQSFMVSHHMHGIIIASFASNHTCMEIYVNCSQFLT